MKTTCAYCHTTKFGLVRQRHYLLVFCSTVCKTTYLRKLVVEKEQANQFHRWLNGAGLNRSA